MIFSDIFQQSLGNLFSNERTLHISRIEDNTVSTDSIANIFVSCLCEASIQYTVIQNANQMSLGFTKRVYP